jgi:tetratricopeptide (TPR) repeat protein
MRCIFARMRSFLLLICVTSFFYACNNGTTENESTLNDSLASINKEYALRQLIVTYPDSALLKERLIQYFRDHDNYDAAIAQTDSIIKKDSTNDRWWDIKATLYSENDDTANAILCWEKASAINPQPRYLLPLGYLYADTKNPKALFISQLLSNSDSSKKNKEAMLISGIYYGKTDKQKALSFFDEALSTSYTFMPAYREKAIVLYNMGKYNEAIKVLETALTVQTTYDEAYYWLGRCYEKLDRKEIAMDSYQHAIDMAKATGNADYEEAIDALEKLRGK